MIHLRSSFAILVFILPSTASGMADKAYEYTVPEKINDGWETASLSSVKLDDKPLRAMVERISNDTYKNIHSALIVKDDKLVFEEYFPRVLGDRREQALKRAAPVPQYSVTKSVTSILIGIAIDQHLISGVDAQISTFFPEYTELLGKPNRSNLRLKDLLTMSAGLSWDEWSRPYTDARNDVVKMIHDPDPIRYVLGKPVAAAPGKTFNYNSGISTVLGQIIRKVSGLRTDRFAERFLFEPLGIDDNYWVKYPDDIVEAGGGLYLRPRDMAKLGRLFLNKGRWNGKQIVSEAWVAESTKNQLGAIRLPGAARADGYGYQWWRTSFKSGDRKVECFSARGRGGQFIFVFPAERVIAVFTGWNDNSLLFQPMDMVQEYVVPAALPTAPNPPAGPKDVQARIRGILEERQAANHIPGLAFVAAKDDKVLFFESIGMRDLDAKLPVTPDTVFPVGSCTKSFTAIAAGISHDRGLLSLDDSPHFGAASLPAAGAAAVRRPVVIFTPAMSSKLSERSS
jgi:CubicO group peptidase (beta-lactamase class C family)